MVYFFYKFIPVTFSMEQVNIIYEMCKGRCMEMANVSKALSFFIAIMLSIVAFSALEYDRKEYFKPSVSLTDMLIAIDPGHGGIDGGASLGEHFNEKDINLDISLRLKELLQKNGIEVIMTRDRDVSLESKSDLRSSRYKRDLDGRRDIIDTSNADVFVSIHANCFRNSPQAKGAIVFYYYDSEQGKKLARCIGNSIDKNVYSGYLGDDKTKTKVLPENLFIIRSTKVPGVLVEAGYMTNREEGALLRQSGFQEAMAEAIFEGLKIYSLNMNSSLYTIID